MVVDIKGYDEWLTNIPDTTEVIISECSKCECDLVLGEKVVYLDNEFYFCSKECCYEYVKENIFDFAYFIFSEFPIVRENRFHKWILKNWDNIDAESYVDCFWCYLYLE